jgi:beta-glucosidase
VGFERCRGEAEEALDQGVGGFILFGGEAGEVRALVADLQHRSRHPLLFGADLERGAGQQFAGCTALPPAAALGALDDLEAVERAGEVTAREARALGVGWIYAPVADLGCEPRNPIVGTRAFGDDPKAVARAVAAWVRGCRAGGGLACVKHFPGHGRTVEDSHATRPVVGANAAELAADLAPFEAAVAEGVPSVMTAHVAYPALDPAGLPATRSGPIIRSLLRERLGFRGLVVTDALIMEGASRGGGDARGAAPGADGEAAAAVETLAAGVDVLLYPRDLAGTARGLARALERGELPAERVDDALARVDAAARSVSEPGAASWGRREDREWALATAVRSVRWVGGAAWGGPGAAPVPLTIVDDDVGGPYPAPSRRPLLDALADRGFDARPGEGSAEARVHLVAVFADTRGWKGRAGLSDEARAAVARAVAAGASEVAGAGALILLFGHPRVAGELPAGVPVLCAWGGEPLMQEAAAEALARGWARP